MDKGETKATASSGESRAETVRRQAEERQKRQAEALRNNLLRRKAQSRARSETADPASQQAEDDGSTDGAPSSS